MGVFTNDYALGAHPAVLDALCETNMVQAAGYGEDQFCQEATDLIRRKVAHSDCAVEFLTGGTQANLVLLAHALRPWEAVLAPDSGHISTHESGAIEATGHKVLCRHTPDGKLTTEQLQDILREHDMPDHMVRPRLVYLSQPTEFGTLYTRHELQEISQFCRTHGLLLYVDGARLASALGAQKGQLELPDYASLCDAFTIGGTKCGALFGEAMVIANRELTAGFRHSMKQRGAMLAKGRLLGVQFHALLQNDLYLELGQLANSMAATLREGLQDMGVSLAVASATNQQFPEFTEKIAHQLVERHGLRIWEPAGEGRLVTRCVTSWATTLQEVHALLDDCRQLLHQSL